MREGLDLRNSLRDEFEHVTGGFLEEVRAEEAQGLMHAGGDLRLRLRVVTPGKLNRGGVSHVDSDHPLS